MLRSRISEKMNGFGSLKINDKKYDFTNRVNSVFFMGPVQMMVEFGFAGSDATTSYFRAKASKFSLLEDAYDENMNTLYSSLADVDLTGMKLMGSDLLRSRISLTGVIERSGVIKSAGFDAVTKQTKILPSIKIPWRNMNITFPDRDLPSVGSNGVWVYDPYKKRIMQLRQDFIARVIVADFDPMTRTLGQFSEIASIPVNGSSGIASDGQNFVVYHTVPGSIQYLDLITDTVTTITLDKLASPDTNLVWDFTLQKLRSYRKRADYSGYTIDLDGNVEYNTGAIVPTFPSSGSSGTMLYSDGNYIVDTKNMIYKVEGEVATKLVQPITTETRKEQFLFDPAGTIVRGTLKNNVGKLGGLIFETYRNAEMALTLLELPNILVSAGDTFELEYNFEMLDQYKEG